MDNTFLYIMYVIYFYHLKFLLKNVIWVFFNYANNSWVICVYSNLNDEGWIYMVSMKVYILIYFDAYYLRSCIGYFY